ncbi:protein FAM163A-like [Stigmatopora argus]
MSAGTIVIAGGILAGVILLCIVALLCYCRLQYYCCKRKERAPAQAPPPEPLPDPLSHFPCDTCDALANDGAAPLAVGPPLGARSPYGRRAAPQTLNGGERLGFHTYYESPPGPVGHVLAGSPPRPYSTEV